MHTHLRYVLLAASSLAFAGCGDGGSTTAADPTATTTVTGTATATATVTETASPGGLPARKDCGDVAFEANTDSGAFDIAATGVGCPVARRVARGAEGQRGEPYDAARGFSCVPAGTVGQLPSVAYECTGPADQRVTFEAS